MRLQPVKSLIFLALLLFIASSAIAKVAGFPETFFGKWAPTLDQCKQFPWGDDPDLIEKIVRRWVGDQLEYRNV